MSSRTSIKQTFAEQPSITFVSFLIQDRALINKEYHNMNGFFLEEKTLLEIVEFKLF